MKLLCLLLSVYVLLLSAKPCCADTDCKAPSAKQQATTTTADTTSNACPDCPPFSICSATSSFFSMAPVGFALPGTAEVVLTHNTIYVQPALPEIALAIWQPPQLG